MIPQIWRRILDINEPLLQTWHSLKPGFHTLHRLFGQFDPALIGRCDQFDHWMMPFEGSWFWHTER
jgi:hypothetical protein